MISLERRDGGRKGLGMGFGGRGEMDETELEEGEAYDYQDDDANIDPDVDLSYLDEKVQDVLGHFQKDFEGGVSAENLGAKFGGYGSFLPTYQRSPSILSHPKTPQKVQSYGTPRSPSNLPSEGALQNSSVSTSVTPFAKLGAASTSAAPPPVSKGAFVENSSRKVYPSLISNAGESTFKREPVKKVPDLRESKSLKVRLKVGSDNVSKKSAAIVSGLGLDFSPSSSPDESPVESGELSPKHCESPDKSPTIILQIMTSSPIPGGMLSPLPDSLLYLKEKKQILRDSRSSVLHKGSQDNNSMLEDSSAAMGEGKVIGGKKIKLLEKSRRSKETKNRVVKDGNDIGAFLKKEIDIETAEGREFVSNSLKLPLLYDSECTFHDHPKDTGRTSDVTAEQKKAKVKDKSQPVDVAKEEILHSKAMRSPKRLEKLKTKTSMGDKVWEDRVENVQKNAQSSPRKDGKSKRNKSYDPVKSDFDGSRGRRDLSDGTIPKDKKALSHEQKDGANVPGRNEELLSGGKKKSKASKSNGFVATEFSNGRLAAVSSATLDKKKNNSDSSSKSKLDDSKWCREPGLLRESLRDVGGVKMDQTGNSLEWPSKDRPKDYKSEAFEKETHHFTDKSKERLSSKRSDTQLTSVSYLKPAPSVAPPTTGNGPVSDTATATATAPTTATATAAPVVIEENWVACDRCQKWRLLPFGTNPDHLPKKWLCSMLNWLPGLNRCSISEEETTKALNALYAIPVHGGQYSQHAQQNGGASGVNLPQIQQIDIDQEPNLHGAPIAGKKKHGLKETSDTIGYVHLPHSTITNQQSSMKSRSLNDVNQSPSQSNKVSKAGIQHVSKSSDSAVEKHRNKRKEKHQLAPDGGNVNRSKVKIKREADPDGYRASKKMKTDGFPYADADWNADMGGVMGKTSIDGLSATTAGQDEHKYVEYSSSKDQNCDAKENIAASARKPKNLIKGSLDGRPQNTSKVDKKDTSTKKRKVKESQESRIYPSDTSNLEANRSTFKEGTHEREFKKGKKIRLPKSEAKESYNSKGSVTADKGDRASGIPVSHSRDLLADGMEYDRSHTEKDQQLVQNRGGNQRMVDNVDLLKRDLAYEQPSLAATSSSSKVSGSRKSKGNFLEAKASPVESVSSSPLRVSNPDKGTSARRILLGKDDANVGFPIMGSPIRCSDGEEDGGSDRSGAMRKEKASSAVNHGSLESTVLDYPDGDANATFGGKAKARNESSHYHFESSPLVNGGADAFDQRDQHAELVGKEHSHEMDRVNNSRNGPNGSLSKSGKGFSSRSKDTQRSAVSDLDKGKVKVSKSHSEQEEFNPTKNSRNEAEIESEDPLHYHKEQKDAKFTFQEKSGVKSVKDDINYLAKKDSAGKWSSESRMENQSKFGGFAGKVNATSAKDGRSNPQQNLLPDYDGRRSSQRCLSDRTDNLETTSRRGKPKLLSYSGDEQEIQTGRPLPMPSTHKGSGSDVLPVDSSSADGGDALKVIKLPKKSDNRAGANHNSLRHSSSIGLVGSDLEGSGTLRKDSSSQPGYSALKEAKDLKHTADRLKNSGSDLDTTGLYFRAALKFLHGASLLESCNIESAKHGETSMQVYSSTASLCEFVAREYERHKETAAAALAYKCMEVAYMRVIYFKHSSANKDRRELQTALQMVPGESPSSSASDLDNLNNHGTQDKVALTKTIGSPSVGNHVIAAQNRPNYERLLNFTQNVNFAMEATRRSHNAFAAATASLEESQYESITTIKRVLDCNFHDVQGLLRLVRLAMEAISR